MLLAGRVVLEWTEDISGSFSARVLGNLGAEVIKVEGPGGDPLRHSNLGPGSGEDAAAALFGYINHGKRSVMLDPSTPEGAAKLMELAQRADILIETEISKGRGHKSIALEEVRKAAPKLVVISITAMGIVGEPASSPLTLQHRAGYAFHEASPVTDPTAQIPVGCTDNEGSLAIGVAAANAAMCGLLTRDSSDEAKHLDVAKFDFYASQLYPGPLGEWNDGKREFNRKRDLFGGTEVAGGLVWIVRCADGWVIVSPREQHQWDHWMQVLDNPAWANDAALCGDRVIRKTNFVRLQELMSEATSKTTRLELFERALQGHVALLPVNYPSDILTTPQLIARDFFDHLKVPGGRTIDVPGLPFRLETGGVELTRGRTVSAPVLGAANDELLDGKPVPAGRESRQLGTVV